MEGIFQHDPDKVTLLFENDFITAVMFDLKPGDTLPRHETGNRIVYSLTASQVKVTDNGREAINKWAPGDVHWHEGGPHPALQNVGDTDARFVMVSRTPVPLPPAVAWKDVEELSAVAPDCMLTLLDNDHIRLLKVSIGVGETLPPHYEGHRLIYTLGPFTVKVGDGEKAAVNEWEEGALHWHNGGEHPRLENVGVRPAEYLIFIFKK